MRIDFRISPSEWRPILGMLARIAIVVFVVEAGVMFYLADWSITPDVLREGLIDATVLTLTASPLIYAWAARPFALAADTAKAALRGEIAEKECQREELLRTSSRQRQLLEQNEQLRRRLQQSSAEFSDINEMLLQRISADLHDGPAQLLALALMRLHKFLPGEGSQPRGAGNAELEQIRSVLTDALREVRGLSSGLALPELKELSLEDVVFLAIGAHEERTGASVSFQVKSLPRSSSHALKVAVYRFVQEGLSNAYRHAGGIGQRVEAGLDECMFFVKVADRGPGLAQGPGTSTKGLGLQGLRGRVESLGGTFDLCSSPNTGTTLTASFDRAFLENPSGNNV